MAIRIPTTGRTAPAAATAAASYSGHTRLALFAIAVTVACLPASVQADNGVADGAVGARDGMEAAARAYDLGGQALVDGDYELAARHFLQAHAHAPTAEALTQAAQALELAGREVEAGNCALAVQRQFADHAQAQTLTTAMLERLAPRLMRVDIACDDCRITVDGSGTPGSFFLAPGPSVTLEVAWDQGVVRRTVVARAGDHGVYQVSPRGVRGPWEVVEPFSEPSAADGAVTAARILDPAPPFGEPPQPGTSSGAGRGGLPPWVAIGAMGVTGGLLATSVALSISAGNGVEPYERAAADLAACSADCNALEARARRLLSDGQDRELLVNVAWAATGVAVVGTTLLAWLWTDWEGRDAQDGVGPELSFQVSPAGPASGALQWTRHF